MNSSPSTTGSERHRSRFLGRLLGFMGLSHLFYPYGFILQALALIHFIRRRPDSYWFFIIMFLGALGAVVYFVAEVVPDFSLLRASFKRAARRKRLKELEAIVEE